MSDTWRYELKNETTGETIHGHPTTLKKAVRKGLNRLYKETNDFTTSQLFADQEAWLLAEADNGSLHIKNFLLSVEAV